MQNKIKIIPLFICFSLFLAGCGHNTEQSDISQTTAASAQTVQESTSETASNHLSEEMFTDRDKEVGYDEDNCVIIQLQNDTALCNTDNVQINDQIITISEEGTYLITGSLSNGMIRIEAADTDKIHLVLDNVSIANSTSAAIYIKEADKVFITLATDSENILTNGGNYTAIDDNNIDAVIFSKSDLTLNGSGSLTVDAKAGHGIVSKDDLVITGGNYNISSASHGLSGKDSIRIADGNFTITSEKDGMQADNEDDDSLGFLYIANGSFTIKAEDDGINSSNYLYIENGSFTIDSVDDALHAAGDININNGEFQISAGDDGMHTDTALNINGGKINISQSYEGLEGLTIHITGGQIDIISDDDGLNAAGGNDGSSFNMSGGMRGGKDNFGADSAASIEISGGVIRVNAEGDGIDSNGSLSVTGGETYVYGPVKSGNASLDYGSEAVITGGIFAASGPSQMAQNFSTDSTQGAMMITVGTQTSGTSVILKDDSGSEIFSFQPDKAFDCIIISCSEIVQGKTYTLTIGSTETSVTMDSLIYGSGAGMNNAPGGMKNHMDKPGNRDDIQSSQPDFLNPEDPNKEKPDFPGDTLPDSDNSL